jgi:hypothetical protein
LLPHENFNTGVGYWSMLAEKTVTAVTQLRFRANRSGRTTRHRHSAEIRCAES